MKLSDCRTWGQVEAFQAACLPCWSDKGRLRFLEWDKLTVRPEGGGFAAWQGQRKLPDVLDENELMKSGWLRARLKWGDVTVHYWRVQLLRGMNCWAFRDPDFESPFYDSVLFEGPSAIEVKRDMDGFYMEARVKRLGDMPAVKRKMWEKSRELTERVCSDWETWKKALQSPRLMEELKHC